MFGDLQVMRYRENPYKNSKKKGYFTVFFKNLGMEIYDFAMFQDEGKRWFSFPSRKYEDKEGNTKYANHLYIPDQIQYQAFMDALRKAFDKYCMEQSGPSVQEPPPQQEPEPRAANNFPDEGLPF